jgi:ActR/RegA family two-component response regulator
MNHESILVIEDDGYQANELKRHLDKIGAVKCIPTELDFYKQVKNAPSLPFKVAVVDMMLRWTDPAPDMEMPPPEVSSQGFLIAGLRCCRTLKERGIHCVIFTALDPNEIPLRVPGEFEIINKSRGYEALVAYVNAVLTDAD